MGGDRAGFPMNRKEEVCPVMEGGGRFTGKGSFKERKVGVKNYQTRAPMGDYLDNSRPNVWREKKQGS